FAGAIKLLSPELLEREGLVSSAFWAGKHFPDDRVDYGLVNPFKAALLREVWANFRAGRAAHLKDEFAAYSTREAPWLDDFALFTAARQSLGVPLQDWPKDLLRRDAATLAATRKQLADDVAMH